MTVLEQALEGTKSVAILGHVRPDGDCLGSTLGLYNYLLASYPDIQAAVYLEEASSKFAYLKGYDEMHPMKQMTKNMSFASALTAVMKNVWGILTCI